VTAVSPGFDIGDALRRAQLIGTLLVLTSAVGFGMAGTISRLAVDDGMSTIGFITWRAILGGVALGVVLLAVVAIGRTVIPRRRQVARRDAAALGVVAVIGTIVNLAMFIAFSRVAIGVAMICFYTYPALVTLGAVRVYGEPIDRRRAAALLLGFAGLAMVLGPDLTSSAGHLDPVGVGLALGASVLQAINVLIMGRGFGAIPITVTAFALNAVAAVCYLALALFLGAGSASLALTGNRAVVLVAFGAIVGAAIPTLANISGIRLIGSARTAILMMLEAVVGVTMAAIFLGQDPEAIQVGGGAAVLIAGAILQLPRHARKVIAERVHPTV
jgi:drug/metabolite transporter (DMT)-like permease